MLGMYLGIFIVRNDNSDIDEIFHETRESASEKTGSKPDTRDGEEGHVVFVVTSKLGVVAGATATQKREKERKRQREREREMNNKIEGTSSLIRTP